MRVKDLENKNVLVLGLGREGLSVLRFLGKHLPTKKISVADKAEKTDLPDNMDKSFFGDDYLKSVLDFDVVIKSPGITPHLPEIEEAISKGVVFSSATDLFFSECKGTVIGITGTKGKSTTSSLIYEFLKAGGKDAYLVGNLGIPALDYLDKGDKDSLFVFELSSHQLMDLKVSPHIAVMTNIYPEHLDYYKDFDEYFRAKAQITLNQNEDDYLVYYLEDNKLGELATKTKAKRIPFVADDIPEELITDKVKLLGKFNLLNIAPAVIIGELYQITREQMKQALDNFQPLPHRLEYVGNIKGIKFYNDSLATIPQATIKAIESLDNVETLIAGGFDRGIDFTELGKYLISSSVENLLLFPTTGEKIWGSIVKADPHTAIKKFDVESMDRAVKIAFEVTDPGKICLLSPASTSFGIFKDYADRGDQFKKYVLEFKEP